MGVTPFPPKSALHKRSEVDQSCYERSSAPVQSERNDRDSEGGCIRQWRSSPMRCVGPTENSWPRLHVREAARETPLQSVPAAIADIPASAIWQLSGLAGSPHRGNREYQPAAYECGRVLRREFRYRVPSAVRGW